MADPTTLAPYTYAPLPTESSIRLITRLGTTPSGHLRLSLSTHDLGTDTPTPFHCLSYTWGNPFAHGEPFKAYYDAVANDYSPNNKIPVEVDGKLLHIQKSLHDALTGLPENPYLEELAYANHRGFTRMHTVAQAGRYGLLYIWAGRGVNFNVINYEGRLPIHYSAEIGDEVGVKILARAGSLRSVKDQQGKTPRDLAAELGHNEIVEFLDAMAEQPDPAPHTVPKDDNGPEKYIWADAVCINQEDVDEKTKQVSMMDTIYSKASCVAAWLGPADSYTTTAIEAIGVLTSHQKQFADSDIIPYSGNDEANYDKAGVPHITRDQWDAIASIYQRQWFRRAWIVQEAVLPELLGLYCGPHRLSARDIGLIARTIREHERRLGTRDSSRYVPLDEIAVSVEWNAAEFMKWRDNLMNTKSGDEKDRPAFRELFKMSDLLSDFRTFLASEPRDKIFAIYGLLNVFTSQRMQSDYRKPVTSVYTEATRRVIEEMGSLDVLLRCFSSASYRQPMEDLPSWVPDWSIPGGVQVPTGFSADSGLQYAAPRLGAADDPVLGLRGLYVGQVSQVSGRVSEGPGGKLMFDPCWLKLALSLRKGEYNEGEEKPILTELLWRTLCMNMSSGGFYSDELGRNAPPEYAQQFTTLMMLLITSGLDQIMIEAAGGKPGYHLDKDILIHIQHDALADMETSLADLDALLEHDGDQCRTPLREDIVFLWNKLEYTLLRISPVKTDEGTLDFTVPPSVTQGTDRLVGCGIVTSGTRIWRKCNGFANTYMTAYGGRQLFTLNNKYLGLAPVSTRADDEVWIIPGSSAPVILRRDASHGGKGKGRAVDSTLRYGFIGAAYVHGLMHGEAVRDGDVLQDIELA